jgi:REP element-mobilizing transposase RayT
MLVHGGIYHIYNRVTRGEHVFADPEEAGRFADRIKKTKLRDGFQVLAWCVMSNHYHLAVRMGDVSLSRSMRTIHHRYSQSFNGRHRTFGPLWRGRFRSRPVETERYLQQVIAYIHLNPVTGGIVDLSEDYPWSGHGEIMGARVPISILDEDEALFAFGQRRSEALDAYQRATLPTRVEEWMASGPGRLPWWRVGKPRNVDQDELVIDGERARIGANGLSTKEVPPPMELEELLEIGARLLGVPLQVISSPSRAAPVVTAREMLALIAVERHGCQVKQIAALLEKRTGTASRWVQRAAARRRRDADFRQRLDALGAALAGTPPRDSPRCVSGSV